ncbi:MAG: hypothetical protein JO092_08430 [Candidatus Eremiobacteraeota bacterium]|nr:hypothetical protein [Candidatus Eremiobacteraeota bacterium]
MLSRIPSKHLTAFVVWVPQRYGTHNAAIGSSRWIDDPRTHHYWDAADASGVAFSHVLRTPGPAWDVYLAYARGVRWNAALPPQPTFWMQQIGMSNVPALNASVLATRVRALLNQQR